MATMVGEVYDALIEAGASADKARKAAEAVAGYEGRASKLEQSVAAEIGDLKRLVIEVRGEQTLLKWMIGVNTVVVVGILLRMLST